jgi:hypothetical protein
MIDDSFVRRIEELADAKALEREIDGVPMSNIKLHDNRPRLPEPAALELHTLGGLVDYLEADTDGLRASMMLTEPTEAELAETAANGGPRLAIHIKSHTEVLLIGELRGTFRQRFTYARARHEVGTFEFGRWHETEDFVIRLGSMFVPGAGDVDAVIKLAGTVNAEQNVKTEDDGITQTITVRQGVTFVGRTALPNPVELAPFRTFNELEQPASKYLLRARGGGAKPVEWTLFPADGGAWKLTAIERAASWLEAELGELAGPIAIIR